MKKSQAEPTGGLTTAVTLLLVFITIGVLILIIFNTGLVSEANTITLVYLTRMSTFVRGVIVAAVLASAWTITDLAAVFIYMSRAQKFDVVGGAILYTLVKFMVLGVLISFAAGIPLYAPTLPLRQVGTYEKPVDVDVFQNRLAEATVDCYYMYGKGEYDPLFAKTPPNPRVCQTLSFNLKEEVTLQELWDYMATEHTVFGNGQSYRIKSSSAEFYTTTINYPGFPNQQKSFSKATNTIQLFGEKWKLEVYYGEYGDLCGKQVDGGGFDICLVNIINPNDKTCICGMGHPPFFLGSVKPRNFELKGSPAYFTINDWEHSTVFEDCVAERGNEYVMCSGWDISIYVGQYSIDSYLSKIDNALADRIVGEIPFNRDEYNFTNGKVIIGYKDHFESVSGYAKDPAVSEKLGYQLGYGNIDCGIFYEDPDSLEDFEDKDQMFWCFIDVNVPKCTTPGQIVCLDYKDGNAVYDGNLHEYIGYCESDTSISNVTNCNSDYCTMIYNTDGNYCEPRTCLCSYPLGDITKNASCFKNKNIECTKSIECFQPGKACLMSQEDNVSAYGQPAEYIADCYLDNKELKLNKSNIKSCSVNYLPPGQSSGPSSCFCFIKDWFGGDPNSIYPEAAFPISYDCMDNPQYGDLIQCGLCTEQWVCDGDARRWRSTDCQLSGGYICSRGCRGDGVCI